MAENSVVFVSHGGGPLPLLGDKGHLEVVSAMRAIPTQLPKPAAIIVISAHWEAPRATVTRAKQPPLIYDYHGFAPGAYEIEYPSPGNPALADEITKQLLKAGLGAAADDERGLDHGTFVPLKLMYPEADIPVVQLSLLADLNPAAHIKMGQALGDLKDENILILGSGQSFHNLPAFFSRPTPQSLAQNKQFEDWLHALCLDESLTAAQRRQALLDWEQAPAARYCHPREEHLLPLLVCYGAAQRKASKAYRFKLMGQESSAFIW